MNLNLFEKSEPQPITVSQLTRTIKSTLESVFSNVLVIGEISNFKRHSSSGHAYFNLKDEGAVISAVMWDSRIGELYFTPQDGMKVIARGRITVYPPRGNYQIEVARLQPAGMGELQIAFEKLKRRLHAEGLFDPEHKKQLPRFPTRIGIVTSETGAALHDIVTVLRRRFPVVEVILYPVRVQGVGAAEEIARAVRHLNEYGEVDVMIVGRGGGSLEDLWAFNEEVVARAIFDSEIPIVSAVGHEVDYSIADLVADRRAPTPSAAAEIIVPDRRELLEIINEFAYTLRCRVSDMLRDGKETVQRLLKTYSFNRPYDLLRSYSQRVDDLERRLNSVISHRLEIIQTHMRSFRQRLNSVDPERVIQRGYAIVYHNGDILETKAETALRGSGDIRFKDGRVGFTVRGN